MDKHRFHPAIFLLLTLVRGAALAQTPPPISSPKVEPPSIGGAHGAYVFVYRTPSHVRTSSSSVFHEVTEAVSEYLAGQHVEVRKVEESDPSALKAENLTILETESTPEVLRRARAAGASQVLFLTVDRPVKSWVRLEMQCFDLSGNKLWEETAANSTALSGKRGLKSALERLQEQLAARMGQPGLLVEGGANAPAIQAAAGKAPGSSPTVGAKAEQSETAAGASATLQAGTEGSEPQQARLGTITQPATVTLPEGTVVRLMLVEPVNSKTAQVGDRVEFSVLEDVKAGDLVVIPRKALASGVVTELIAPQRRERPGWITIKAETVSLPNHETATLRGLRTLKSANQNVDLATTGDMYAIIEATQGLGIPFLPLLMFKHGEWVVLPAGMEFPAVLDHPVIMERAGLLEAQPAPTEKRHGNPVVIVYHHSNPPTDRPKLYCGKAEVARLENSTKFQLTLPPGKYWFRSNGVRKPVPLSLEEGGEYYLRVDSVMTWGNPRNPGYSQSIRIRDHEVGELEAAAASPLNPKNIKDVSRIDAAKLTAGPE